MKAEQRRADLRRFYEILAMLEQIQGGVRTLATCSGRMNWPHRGVYFFFEPGENRTTTGTSPRVGRVGTHALKEGACTSLWGRLSQHKGQQSSGGGNHRGSVFRKLVGSALMARDPAQYCPTWGKGNSASTSIREKERALEVSVSRIIGAMPLLWLAVDDEPGPGSMRAYIERNSIALLSNYDRSPLDAPSSNWLGQFSDSPKVVRSGLWNSNHVEELPEPGSLDVLTEFVAKARPTDS